jgi:hypothetical protein
MMWWPKRSPTHTPPHCRGDGIPRRARRLHADFVKQAFSDKGPKPTARTVRISADHMLLGHMMTPRYACAAQTVNPTAQSDSAYTPAVGDSIPSAPTSVIPFRVNLFLAIRPLPGRVKAETSDAHRHVRRRLVGVLGRDARYSVLRDPRVARYLEGQELGCRRRGRG